MLRHFLLYLLASSTPKVSSLPASTYLRAYSQGLYEEWRGESVTLLYTNTDS